MGGGQRRGGGGIKRTHVIGNRNRSNINCVAESQFRKKIDKTTQGPSIRYLGGGGGVKSLIHSIAYYMQKGGVGV